MTNTIESLTTNLIDTRNDIALLKIQERDLLKKIAELAIQESGGDVLAASAAVTDAVLVAEKKPGSKQPDPTSKRQRAFRMIQKNWSTAAIARSLNISTDTIGAYRRQLKNGAKVAGV